jgi:16S rRNA (adenine1518-N6/adenine1519-N6)-dimethyltransferase
VRVALQKIAKLPASQHTDQEFIWVYRGSISSDLVPNKSEIERGAFLSPSVIDGWTSSRPEDFAPGFLECWKAHRQQRRSGGGLSVAHKFSPRQTA